MAIHPILGRIPLRSLGISHEVIQLCEDAGLFTIQDFEDRTSNIFRSKYYNEVRLKEIADTLLKQMEMLQEIVEELERKV
jgi:hypothetical protein